MKLRKIFALFRASPCGITSNSVKTLHRQYDTLAPYCYFKSLPMMVLENAPLSTQKPQIKTQADASGTKPRPANPTAALPTAEKVKEMHIATYLNNDSCKNAILVNLRHRD